MKRSGKAMRKTRIKVKGDSDTATLKDEIQGLVRQIVIKRDGGCIFRDLPDRIYNQPPCNGYRKDGELILQADHLISRGSSATFADTRLIVCVCKGHHGWKSVGSNLRKREYDEIVRKIIEKERVALWDKHEAERFSSNRKGSYDWKLEILALKQELKQYETN
jgi:hypothetical protein